LGHGWLRDTHSTSHLSLRNSKLFTPGNELVHQVLAFRVISDGKLKFFILTHSVISFKVEVDKFYVIV
jgi:hypothetical protein